MIVWKIRINFCCRIMFKNQECLILPAKQGVSGLSVEGFCYSSAFPHRHRWEERLEGESCSVWRNGKGRQRINGRRMEKISYPPHERVGRGAYSHSLLMSSMTFRLSVDTDWKEALRKDRYEIVVYFQDPELENHDAESTAATTITNLFKVSSLSQLERYQWSIRFLSDELLTMFGMFTYLELSLY